MTATPPASKALIEQYQDLVRSIAISVRRKVPPNIELDDLIAYGQIGLAEAARDFDPKRGNAFSTYAYHRIRGAVYDGVSKLCWTSRSRHNRMRNEQAAGELEKVQEDNLKSTSEPTTPDRVTHRVDGTSDRIVRVYLAACATGDSQASSMMLADPAAQAPSELAADHEASRKVRALVEALPSREAHVIRTVYFEGRSLQEAGRELGISKSWASRLHAKALQQLARSLRLEGLSD